MQAMGDLRNVAGEIMRRLEGGSLPVSTGTETSTSDRYAKSDPPARTRPSTVERLTEAQARRREVIKAMILRYRMEKKLPPFRDDALYDEVRWHDEHFTRAGIPTERIKDVYLEAVAQHGRYPLNVDDYLRAWARLQPKENDGVDLRAMGERGADCAICAGTGTIKKFVPDNVFYPLAGGREVEVPCPYRCKSALVVRASAGLHKVA
jgi:hypothetical protein